MMRRTSDLAAQQDAFMAHILSDEAALPHGWTARHRAGMDIYRNAYRARLVDALRDTYERTANYVGEDAFRQAAAHHVIGHPPGSWTLDDAGAGFAQTVEELFTDDSEVAELVWLEWAMHRAFVAADTAPLDAAKFADIAAQFADEDWAHMRIGFLPGTAVREMACDIVSLWRAAPPESDTEPAERTSDDAVSCVVWREGLKPVFVEASIVEGRALQCMLNGADYGTMCAMLVDLMGEDAALSEAGAILARWLHNGLIAKVDKGPME